MTVCQTCSCGNALSVSETNTETAVRCSRCGRIASPSEKSDSAKETRLFDTPGITTFHSETRVTVSSTSAVDSDGFDGTPPPLTDAVTKVMDSGLEADNDGAKPPSSAYSGHFRSSFGSRSGSEGGRASEIDLKQPIMAAISREPLPVAISALDNGQYGAHQILQPHQKGGMGQILIAYDQFLKRRVALKELHQEVVGDLSIVQRFIGEAEVTAQLEHPGIVPVHTLGLNAGNPYYTMKLIKGHTLQDAIKDYHRNPSKAGLIGLVRRLIAVCKTMSFAHDNGVIHRDLKPANIMLGEHGETLVMDWGLAKSLHHPEEETITFTQTSASLERHEVVRPELTMVGAVVGTLAFMSPEQAMPESGTVGPLADIFSLGAVLYYLLTGQTAFRGRSMPEILNKVRNSTPAKPSQIQHIKNHVPADLEAVCLKAMSRNPADRYQSAAEMSMDLGRWLDNEPVHARKETFLRRVWRWFRKHRHIPTILILAILLTALGAALDHIVFVKPMPERIDPMLHHAVDLLSQPSVAMEGSNGVFCRLEKKRTGEGTPSLHITLPRGGGNLTGFAPGRQTWNLTSRQFLMLSMLERESGITGPLENFFVRLGNGSAYFEFRPSKEWWAERTRGSWSTVSIPLDGSDAWTKTPVNNPSMESICWFELHFETEKPTTLWIDNLYFSQRPND